MSILIKGVEMPTSCDECRFCDNDAMCVILGEDLFDYVQAEVADHIRYLPDDWICDDCPLIPVPPHGRLIDADAFERGLKKFNVIVEEDLQDVIYALRDYPAIIEAEGKDDEHTD